MTSSESLENTTWEDLARGTDAAKAETADRLLRYLTFELAGDLYAVPVESVRELVRIRPITPVPRVSAEIRGVISLRGEILQVVDLRRRLGLESVEPGRTSRIVVVRLEDDRVAGILVDAVHEVLTVSEDSIVPPSGVESVAVESLCRRGERFVSMIALDRVLQFDAHE